MKKEEHYRDSGERAVEIGRYVAQTGATVRNAAKKFGISKSTAHKDLTVKLKSENRTLYTQVAQVLSKNKSERHIRGGMATRDKYMHMKRIKSRSAAKDF